MKKDTKKLESAERARLESGKKDGAPFDFWNGFDYREYRRIKREKMREKAKAWGRAFRIPATIVLCTCIIVLCIVFLVPRNTPSEAPITDVTTDTESDMPTSDTTEMIESTESESGIQTSDTADASEDTATQTSAQTESDTESDTETDNELDTESEIPAFNIYDFDYSSVPEGSVAIVPADLSLISFGENYINNSTGYTPNIKDLLYDDLGSDGLESLSAASGPESNAPLVLILHTHGTEAYVDHGALYYTDDGSEFARSHNAKENVVAVGSVLADVLNRAGIPTLHSTVLHDSVQYKDAYARSSETVKKYLETYPSIKLVIDLHRDSVINSNGDVIKPITLADGERCAQIKCTVGSSWSGEKHDTWEKNLSLALKLRRELNDRYTNICRPVSLESTTYNQQLAPYSLLVEIGASGNSLEEAMCAANALGKILAMIVKNI